MRSVVICAYTEDRWELLQRAVASAAAQGDDVEVVVVIDHNEALLARAVPAWPNHVVVPNRHGRGLSGARNTGIEASEGDLIAFLDDDAEADPGWLDALSKVFSDPTVGGAGGHVAPHWTGPVPDWFPSEFGWVVGCSYTGQPDRVGEVRNPIGASMLFRRDVFTEVGGFREEIGRVGTLPLGCEETELSIRARRAGYTIWYLPDAVIHHVVPAARSSWRYFVRRCYSEGISKAFVSNMAGHEAGLESERTYVTRTLPSGIARALRQAWTSRSDGAACRGALGRAAAIVAGVACASAGFARGTITLRRKGLVLQPAPTLRMRVDSIG